MILVVGIAASVLIQTSTTLEYQSMTTGQQTIEEVSSGINVFDISGYAATNSITKLAITVSPRPGSPYINLNETFIELSDTSSKVILDFTGAGGDWNDSASGVDDIFGVSVFPAAANRYGIMVLEDKDGSCTSTNPIINKGDKVYLTVDTSQCFTSGISVRTDIWGAVVGEDGSPGIIAFTTPATYGSSSENVFDLQ